MQMAVAAGDFFETLWSENHVSSIRGRNETYRRVIARREAPKQSHRLLLFPEDCFAALAMTVNGEYFGYSLK